MPRKPNAEAVLRGYDSTQQVPPTPGMEQSVDIRDTLGPSGGDKLSQKMANYRMADGPQTCGACAFYEPGNTCSQVQGVIQPTYTCDLYAEAK